MDENIVFYDLSVEAAQARRRADGRYEVTVRVGAGKIRADGQGNEQPIAFDEPIEIAIATDAKVLDSRRHALRRGMNEIRLVVDAQPSSVTVIPDHADRSEPVGQCEAVLRGGLG